MTIVVQTLPYIFPELPARSQDKHLSSSQMVPDLNAERLLAQVRETAGE